MQNQNTEHIAQVADACKKAGATAVDVLPIDLKSSQSIDQLADTLLRKYKCIDVLVNCAGIFSLKGQTPLEGMPASHKDVLICRICD